ncbi:adenylate/guanylate cyclase domain-containing protein [Mycobacterium sp. EPa45]|uniref:adenylate/guanylate cyclase domain-containing protein n=1 Tax=Mycobacterium sp. EPa45 TaxID=1545728 RepID=UPI0011876921|nr:adenylate/guanylate cyclase domain-containing protein [Mycobacterium sp. EPa45]
MTFLFTDVEGSTRRWESDAGEMRLALADHDDVLSRSIATHGGYLFKHTGDGVCAAFASPSSAARAAIEAQRGLALPVRMGIATGEAELRGGDYFGPVLNRVARVMAAGHGGQILLADSTMRLVTDIDVADLGPHLLRDVPEPIGLFQVYGSGLQTHFPPLRTLSRRLGNLRPPASSFVGREEDLSNVVAAVQSCRLVTLTGVGGVGKTRLALETARQMSNEFADGMWLVELASVSDPGAVPDAVAAVLGVTQQPGRDLTENVADAIAEKSLLLVIDNCEHVRDAAAELIDAVLADATAVRIVATSREGLGVVGERLWAVPSLDVNNGIDSAAVDLFVDRARTVSAGFELADSGEAATAVEICRRLDGIPLAIELAASRMASMTVSEVRDRLDQRFRLLVGSRRGLERHQTLRHTVAWSFDLLEPAEMALLQTCSVFSGGFDLAGAHSVAADEYTDEFVVLDLLDALVRKSLLVAQRVSGRTRYSMLETIRQFAEDRLIDSGSASEARSAHAAYFAGQEAALEALWDSPRQREAYDWFSCELPNLRSAFRWAADESQLDAAITLAVYASFLGLSTENLEPLAWPEELIPAARAAHHPRLALLLASAAQCWTLGRSDDALRFASAALDELRVNPHTGFPLGIEGLLAAGFLAGGEPQRALDYCRYRIESSSAPTTLVKVTLAVALAAAGEVDEAGIVASAVLNDGEVIENPYLESYAVLGLSTALAVTDPASAMVVLRRGIEVALHSGNRSLATHLTSGLSRVTASHGEPREALDQLSTVIRHYLDSGNLANLRNALAVLAGLLHRWGHSTAAGLLAGFAINPFVSVTMPEIATTVAHLRDNLGREALDALMAKGAAMSKQAMVELVEKEIAALRSEIDSKW